MEDSPNLCCLALRRTCVFLLCASFFQWSLYGLSRLFSLKQRPITLVHLFLNSLAWFLLGLGVISHQRRFSSPVQAGGKMQEVHPQGSSSRLQVLNRTGQVSAAKSLSSPKAGGRRWWWPQLSSFHLPLPPPGFSKKNLHSKRPLTELAHSRPWPSLLQTVISLEGTTGFSLQCHL